MKREGGGRGESGTTDGHRRWLQGDRDPAAAQLRGALDEAQLRGPDDVALRRMWGRVAEPSFGAAAAPDAGPAGLGRRRAPRWIWFAGGVASSAAAALALTAWLQARNPVPEHRPRKEIATHTRGEPTGAVGEPRPAVVTPGRVRTGAGETLRLTLPGGAEARMGASSVLRLDEHERPVVEGGEIGFTVPHQEPGHSFVVMAGPYRVVVVGTMFRLTVDERSRVFVSVEEGQVEIWDRTRLARLAPGERWFSPEGPAATSAVKDTPAPARHRARAGGGTPAAPAVDASGDARAALAAGDVPRALSLYRALAQRGGPAGENAEYEIGKIQLDRLRQPSSAIATWRAYRTAHPNGVLRVEADVSIIDALVHAGDLDAALKETAAFLEDHPGSERRAEIARVAGDLYRTRGDCSRAVAAYETALSAPRGGGVLEAATFHRASCLVKMGDAAGQAAARAYLQAWPAGRFRDQATQLVAAGQRP